MAAFWNAAARTECVDLAKLAGLTPAAMICEVMNDDRTMARLSDLTVFARRHDKENHLGEGAGGLSPRSETIRGDLRAAG
ncbi:MAG: 3,4-dihydroxy-2-butanone-4-phosphate synthase [Parvularculaceae bacterium]